MTHIRFTIPGNQEDPQGNPIPYIRMLSGKIREDARRYIEWKEYVRSALHKGATIQVHEYEPEKPYEPQYTPETLPYPLLVRGAQEVAVHVQIYWKNDQHADGDNILKGIMDALFYDDKCVWAGSFESRKSLGGAGRVEVLLDISL